jgi:hypothetical protein
MAVMAKRENRNTYNWKAVEARSHFTNCEPLNLQQLFIDESVVKEQNAAFLCPCCESQLDEIRKLTPPNDELLRLAKTRTPTAQWYSADEDKPF